MTAPYPLPDFCTETMTGAEMVLRALKDQGVSVIFGYPGGAALPTYDALHRQSDVRHILVRHEQAAVHAAQGYARATGEVGCVLVTSGPGATNTVTGLMDAKMDSTPIVVICGQVATHLIGTNAFQECDIVSITRPCTKYNYAVRNVGELPHILHEAFHIARSGRPGPVLIDIPKDIQTQAAPYHAIGVHENRNHRPHPIKTRPIEFFADAIHRSAAMIANAQRPVFYTGGGLIHSGPRAIAALASIVCQTDAPVTSTLMGLGAFPASSPQWLGMLGMHGTYEANKAMHEADVIISVGARFDDRVTGKTDAFAPKAKIIHIDIDAREIGKIIPADIAIVGDCGEALTALRRELAAALPQPDLKDWWQKIEDWRNLDSLAFASVPGRLMPQQVIRMLYDEVRRIAGKRRVIVTTDVGQHQMFTAQYFGFDQPRSLITSGGLGTMGFGLPAAIGAQIACPDALVICITGDGSFQMNSQEMATARGLPVKVLILNNESLGMVGQWQHMFYEDRLSQSPMPSEDQPDFVLLAAAYGWQGIRCVQDKDIEKTLKAFLDAKGPILADIKIANEECFPMIAAGKAHNEMLGVKGPFPL